MKVHYSNGSGYIAPVTDEIVLDVNTDILSSSETVVSNEDMSISGLSEEWI